MVDSIVYYIFAGMLRSQVEVGKGERWLHFFALIVDLISDWQACNGDEERAVFLGAVKRALDSISPSFLPDEVIEARLSSMGNL